MAQMAYRVYALCFTLMSGSKNSHAKHSIGQKKRLRPGQADIRSKLDDSLERKFTALVREGLSYERCCDLCAVSRQTFYDWVSRGTAEPESRYGRFERAVRKANAQAVRKLHNDIRKSNPQWILERRFPSEYGPPKLRTETELTGKIDVEPAGKWDLTISCTGEIPVYPVVDSRTLQPIQSNDADGNSA
jgi:transposase